jgi:hypothetical protein
VKVIGEFKGSNLRVQLIQYMVNSDLRLLLYEDHLTSQLQKTGYDLDVLPVTFQDEDLSLCDVRGPLILPIKYSLSRRT